MVTTRIGLALLSGLVALAALPAAADSIRCRGGIVSTGDRKIDLLGKCGPATLVDRQEVKRVRVATGGPGAGDPAAGALAASALGAVTVEVETWTYDLGPSQFVRLVTIEQGRVTRVETAAHGHAAPPERSRFRASRCDPASIDVGDSKLELLATCGEPTLRDAWEEVRGEGISAGGQGEAVIVTATVEVWTYDFGPNRFVRLARIEGGKVTAVETGGYGYGE